MGKRFDGQVVWITGGGSGIGEAMALEFARRGASVAVSGRRQDRLEQVAQKVDALGQRGLAVRCDVTDEAEVHAAANEVASTLGKMDVAVANAGFGVVGRVVELTAADWRRQLDVNVVGAAVTVAAAYPHLEKTKGRLALIGSVSGQLATPKSGAYTASKYALRAIGQTLSIELAGSGVTCTTIHPGFVESEIAQVDNDGVFHAEAKDKRPAKLMWPTDKAARVMVNAVASRRREVTFTAHGKFGAWMGRHMPGVAHMIMTRA